MIGSASLLLLFLLAGWPGQAPATGSAARSLVDPYSAHFAAGNLALEEGRIQDARAAFEECLALGPEGSICSYYLACTAARAGQGSEALEWLVMAVKQGYVDAAVASFEPDLASLREIPAFAALLEEMRGNASERKPEVGALELRAVSSLEIEDLSPDGERFVTRRPYERGEVFLFDRASGECLAVLAPPKGDATSARFGPDGELLILNGEAGLTLWNGRTGEYHGRAAEPATGSDSYTLTIDRRLYLARRGMDGVWIWNVGRAESLVGSLSGNEGQLRVSPGRDLLLSVTGRIQGHLRFTTASLLDLESGKLLRRFETAGRPLSGCGFSSSGRLAYFRSSYRGECHTIDITESRSILATFRGDGPLTDVAFLPDSERIVATDEAGLLLVFEARSGARLRSFELELEDHTVHTLAAVDPSGRLVLTLSRVPEQASRWVRAWNLTEQSPVWELQLPDWIRVRGIRFTRDGEQVLLSSRRSLRVVESATGKEIGRTVLPLHSTELVPGLTRDEVLVAESDGSFVAFDPGTARPTASLLSPAPGFRPRAVDGTGRFLVGIDDAWLVHGIELDGERRRWTFSWPERFRASGKPVIELDPTGARVLLRGRWSVTLLDAATGEPLGTWEHPEQTAIGGTAWSPGGERLAVTLWSGGVLFLDGATLAEEGEPLVSEGRAWCAAFLQDGRHLVTGSENGLARVWDLEERRVVRELVHEDPFYRRNVFEVLPHPDGKHLFTTTGGTRGVWCWEIASGTLVWSHSYDGGWESKLGIHLDPGGEQLFVPSEYFFGPWIFDALSGERLDDPQAGPRADFRPTPEGRFAVASRSGRLDVIQARTAVPLYRWHAAAGDAYLVTTPRGYYAGDPGTALSFHAIANDASHPLDGYAAALCDPKRIAAIAAGIEVLPARPGKPPTVTVESPTGRFANVEDNGFLLEVVASDDEAVLRFEIQRDGEPLDPALLEANTTFEADGRRARLHLELPTPSAATTLRIRARDRRGLLSRPALLTVE